MIATKIEKHCTILSEIIKKNHKEFKDKNVVITPPHLIAALPDLELFNENPSTNRLINIQTSAANNFYNLSSYTVLSGYRIEYRTFLDDRRLFYDKPYRDPRYGSMLFDIVTSKINQRAMQKKKQFQSSIDYWDDGSHLESFYSRYLCKEPEDCWTGLGKIISFL